MNKNLETGIRINKVSLINKKITGTAVVLLWFITITGAQASRDMVDRQLLDSPMAEYSTSNEYKPISPFKVDRDKDYTSNKAAINEISKSKYLVLRKNGLLSKELESWVNQRGYTLLWNSNRDYIIYNTITLSADSFDNILNELGNLFNSENYGLLIKQYEVNKVIIIDAQ